MEIVVKDYSFNYMIIHLGLPFRKTRNKMLITDVFMMIFMYLKDLLLVPTLRLAHLLSGCALPPWTLTGWNSCRVLMGTTGALFRKVSTRQQTVLKSGARDADRAAGPDLSTVHSAFKSVLVQLICFPGNKNKHASDVYETCPGSANLDTNRDLIGHNGFKKQPPLKQLFISPLFKTQLLYLMSVVAMH